MGYEPFYHLMNGSIFKAAFGTYDVAFGGSGIEFLIFYVGILILVGLATESPAPVGVWTVLGAAIFLDKMPPALQPIVYGIAVLGIAMTLYKIFMYKRGAQV